MSIRFLGCLIGLLLAGGRLAPARAQSVRAVKLPALQELLARPTDTTYVVNFWATWCKPCIEELPTFERVRAAHAGRPVQFVLVSLDFRSKLDPKVRPFVQQHKLGAILWLLDETDANQFIDQVEPVWSGAIPFTLVYNNARHHRQHFERPLTEAELTTAVKQVGGF